MPAAGHEVKIIERVTRKRLRLAADSILRICIKDHDVRHFQRRRRTDAHTRRKARGDRALRCTDGRNGIGRVIIRLKVECADDAAAHSAARQRTLHEHKAVRHGAKHAAVQISVHRLLNGARRRRFVTLAEVKLRQHQPQRRGCVADRVLHCAPIGGVRRELVAGNDAPAMHIRTLRQQNIRRGKKQVLVHSRLHFSALPTARSQLS